MRVIHPPAVSGTERTADCWPLGSEAYGLLAAISPLSWHALSASVRRPDRAAPPGIRPSSAQADLVWSDGVSFVFQGVSNSAALEGSGTTKLPTYIGDP